MVLAALCTFLPPAGLVAWLPQVDLVGPPPAPPHPCSAIPQQDPLLCLAWALGTSPPALQSTFTRIHEFANRLKPTEDRDSGLADACSPESPKLPFS